MKLVNNLDFNKYEAQNIKLQNLAAAPASPVAGQAYFDTTIKDVRVWSGTAWVNLGLQGTVTGVTGTAPITSSGGATPAIGITAATQSAAGSMSAADKAKLDNVAAGATANQTDAYLLNRANHTGSQAISTVTNLQSSLDAKLDDSQLGAANGVASLDAGGKIPTTQLPALALTDVNVVADNAARDALVTTPGVQEGDVAIVTSTSTSYVWDGTAWQALQSPADGVLSIIAGVGITSTGGSNPTVSVDTNVVARKVGGTLGDGAATSFVLTHNFNTRNIQVSVYTNAAPYDDVICDVERTSVNTVTVRFGTAPAANGFGWAITG
jgi:hypothetical protein